MNHNPVCKKCQCEMKPETNGVGLLDMFSPSGVTEAQPYQVWDADLWKCPKCGVEVVLGFGVGALSNHHEESFHWVIKGYELRGMLIKNYPLV